jgi:hypothetical protein
MGLCFSKKYPKLEFLPAFIEYPICPLYDSKIPYLSYGLLLPAYPGILAMNLPEKYMINEYKKYPIILDDDKNFITEL